MNKIPEKLKILRDVEYSGKIDLETGLPRVRYHRVGNQWYIPVLEVGFDAESPDKNIGSLNFILDQYFGKIGRSSMERTKTIFSHAYGIPDLPPEKVLFERYLGGIQALIQLDPSIEHMDLEQVGKLFIPRWNSAKLELETMR